MSRVELVENDMVTEEASRWAGQCVGCGICELVCSFSHEEICAPSLSAIRLRREEQKWYTFETSLPYRIDVCRQCASPSPCEEACQVEGALVWNPDVEGILVNYSKCTACGKCLEACPYDGIWFSEGAGKIIKCDLCGGEPKCVKWCPTGVIKYLANKGGA